MNSPALSLAVPPLVSGIRHDLATEDWVSLDLPADKFFRFSVTGRIDAVGTGATNDVVLRVRFFCADGTPIDSVADALLWSKEAGNYFYPLKGAKRGVFSKVFHAREPL